MRACCGAPCAQLERRLVGFSNAVAAAREAVQTQVAPLDDQDLEELRALGYPD